MTTRIAIALPVPWSDGDSENWPSGNYVHQSDDRLYHEKVADLWMSHTKQAAPGIKYTFTQLPTNYRIYTKTRKSGLADRYIFGHGKGRFDSPNKFFEHFKWLMGGGAGVCECINCPATSTVPKPEKTPAVRPTPNLPKVDVGDNYIMNRLTAAIERPGAEMDEEFKDESDDLNIDRRSFKEIAQEYRNEDSFLPRVGEMVLFYPNHEPMGRWTRNAQGFKTLDKDGNDEFPMWKAGVVVQRPEETPGRNDLSLPPRGDMSEAHHCFKVELYADPGGDDKTLSRQSHYVALSHIRPLTIYHEVLSGISQLFWDPTIFNALKITVRAALVDRTSKTVRWNNSESVPFPFVTICSRGIWIGSELIVLGDAVRVRNCVGPEKVPREPVDEVLVVERIEWVCNLSGAANSQFDCDVHVLGKKYTTNKDKGARSTPVNVKDEEETFGGVWPSSFEGYTWYSMADPDNYQPEIPESQTFRVPLSMVLGRLYCAQAMSDFIGTKSINASATGMWKARAWAKTTNKVIFNTDVPWFLTNDLVEMLGLESFSGIPVGRGREREGISSYRLSSGKPSEHTSAAGASQSRGFPLSNPLINLQGSDTGSIESTQRGSQNRTVTSTVQVNHMGDYSNGGDGDDLESDGRSTGARSVKSIKTIRSNHVSDDEDGNEDPDVFISDVLAGTALPADEDEEESEEDGSDEDVNDDSDERSAKRPRICNDDSN